MGLSLSEKIEAYRSLVRERQACGECRGMGLENPHAVDKEFDRDEIGPWSLWQGSLSANTVIVGQDWGDLEYYLQHRGRDSDDNPTNKNLIRLLRSIGVTVDKPSSLLKNDSLFFTNAALCLKSGGMSARIDHNCYLRCGKLFLKPLLDIIKPQNIITLGTKAYETVVHIYGIKKDSLKRVAGKKIELDGGTLLFPVYHCGEYGVNTNRSWELQLKDWERFKLFVLRRRAAR